jgi:hypothetical protein
VWATEEPFASILRGDLDAVAAQGKGALAKLIAATHGGMTVDQFRAHGRAAKGGWLRVDMARDRDSIYPGSAFGTRCLERRAG